MAIFSPKARRVVEAAVQGLPDDLQRQAWESWSRANPAVRRAGDPPANIQELPTRTAIVALVALDRLAVKLSKSLESGDAGEDEIFDIEGDITFIRVIESMLIESLHASGVGA